MIGRRAVFCAWMTVSSSISLAQEISLSLMLVGISPPFSVVRCSFDRHCVWSEGLEPSSPMWRTGILAVGRRPRIALLRWTPGRDSHPRLVACSHAPELLGHRALNLLERTCVVRAAHDAAK